MDASIRRELRFLKAWAVISSLLFVCFGLSAFRQPRPQKQRFGEIDVQRINVVEPDGKLRMVISNRKLSIGPVYKGKPFGYAGGTRPGIIFFNDEGTENGGLTFEGRQNKDGTYNAQTGMSFDQFNQDQVVVLNYRDDNGRKEAALRLSERANIDILHMVAERDSIMKLPAGAARDADLERWAGPRNGVPLYAERVYVGRARNKAAMVNLSDMQGMPRLRLMVDSLGTPSLEFLDAKGKVTLRLPEH